MKKTLLILSALLLTAVGASAQITDVTEQYITNPSFETVTVTNLTMDGDRCDETVGGAWKVSELTNWTLTNASNFDICDLMTKDATATDNDLGTPGEAADGTYMLYLKKTWSNPSSTASIKQIATMPAGTYRLTVDSKCFTGGASANLVAGSASKAITINGTSGGNTTTGYYPMSELTAWTTNELTFTVTLDEGEDEAEVEIGVEFTFTNNAPGSFVLDNFKLYSINYACDITKQLANPSFEDVDVDDLTVDTTRGPEEGGAWTVTSLDGWNLAAPTHSTAAYAVSDIMSAAATSTDDNFGVPGEPSDETYMLYLRESHENYSGAGTSASVMQSVVLPAGEYKLTVDSKCVASMEAAETVTLVAGDESQALDIHVKTERVATDPFLDAWDTAVLTFSLKETTEVTLGVAIAYDNTQDLALSVLLDNFQLFSTEEVEAIDINNDVTWKISNPSFEVDNVMADLEADGGRGNSVTTLTGWDLSLSEVDHCDLMTKDATETDNNLGVPSAAAEGTYWLYLKKSWGNNAGSASVKQKVTLPAGDYKLTVQSMAVAASATAKLVAGDESTAITINATSASEGLLTTTEWTTNDLVFTVEAEEGKEAEVELGVDFTFPTGADVGSILIDNFKLYSVAAIEEEISWTLTPANWGTMILPFAASIPEGLTLYDGNALTIDESTITVGTKATTIAANTPYLVKGEVEQDTEYTFSGTPTNEGEIHTAGVLTGTLVDLAVGKGAAFATDGTMYLLQNHNEDVAFYPIIISDESDETEDSSDATLEAYHCYLTIESDDTDEGEPAKLSIVLPGAGEETGIVAVESEALANDAIYDLSGRRVSKAVKGVYIQNGKKVLVK